MTGSANNPGIAYRTIHSIFDSLKRRKTTEDAKVTNVVTEPFTFSVTVSMFEVYNEQIKDLFSNETDKLDLHTNSEGHVEIAGLRKELVLNVGEVLVFLEKGTKNRATGDFDTLAIASVT